MNKNELPLLGENFDDQTVLITGHTGFKGAWLSAWLRQLVPVVGAVAEFVPMLSASQELRLEASLRYKSKFI